jgi:rRNA maturation protein Rpf1
LILISTSRRPTSIIRRFSRDLNRVLPNCVYVNRGKQNVVGIIENARTHNADKVILVERWKGGVGKLRFYSVSSNAFTVTPPLLILRSVKTQADFGRKKRIGRKIGFTLSKNISRSGEKLLQFLVHFLQIPLQIENSAKTGYSAALNLSSLPDGDIRLTVTSPPLSREVGPRINIKKIVW